VSFDGHFEAAIVRGKENAEVIQLAHNHCVHMEFVPFVALPSGPRTRYARPQ
jgi:hypothetical protein